ncbi:hypothetical protein C0Q70_04723 [Pomacea canaliculata]|uniref:Sushi domain-containing protein n=1 Tax=Pomacea canaliculata TaxID=400727 RepID=A0A2T7PJ83_POMCA|nr:putative GPI-anchored protein pfl2 [Pomacea canaliculata]PVD33467.1 hypothetical protein C0Q70_04723 [Pomacea canaliculata]
MNINFGLLLLVVWKSAIGNVAKGNSCGPVKFENGIRRIISKEPVSPTRMEFKCNNTFHLIGEKNGACLPNGRFSVNIPFCARSGCPKIQEPSNVTVTEEIEGKVLHFQCGVGMRRSGPQRLMCDGRRWNSDPPICVQSGLPNCDFEEHSFCGWSQDLNDSHDWQWISKATPILETGPLDDYSGKDHYILIDNAFPNDETHVTRLLSPLLPSSERLCMSFDYQMRADDKEKDVGFLEIYVKDAKHEHRILRLKNLTESCWVTKKKRIPEQCADFQIVLSATRGKSSVGYIAVDNIKFTSCPRNTNDTSLLSLCSKDNTSRDYTSSTLSEKTKQRTESTSRELRSKEREMTSTEELTDMTVNQGGTETSLPVTDRLTNDSNSFTSADDSLLTTELNSLEAYTSTLIPDSTWLDDETTKETVMTAGSTYSTSSTSDNFSSTVVIMDDSSETNYLNLESSTAITISDFANKVLTEPPSTSTQVLHTSDDSSRTLETQTASEGRSTGISYSPGKTTLISTSTVSTVTVGQNIAESSSAVFMESTGLTGEYNSVRTQASKMKSGRDAGEVRPMNSGSFAVSSPKEPTVHGSKLETIASTDNKKQPLDDGNDNKKNDTSRKQEISDDIDVSTDLPLIGAVCLGTALGMSLMGWAAWKWVQNQKQKLENGENHVDEEAPNSALTEIESQTGTEVVMTTTK